MTLVDLMGRDCHASRPDNLPNLPCHTLTQLGLALTSNLLRHVRVRPPCFWLRGFYTAMANHTAYSEPAHTESSQGFTRSTALG